MSQVEFEKACENRDIETINNIILSGFEPNSDKIYNILRDLVDYDKIEAVRILASKIDLSGKVGSPFDPYENHPFHKVRSFEMAKILIENGSSKIFDQWSMEPLLWPYDQNRELFKYLIENCKTENEIESYLDFTPSGMGYVWPLDEAYCKNDLDMIEFLLKNGFENGPFGPTV